MIGLCLDGFLEVRVTEDEDGNPVDAEKVDDIMYDENGDVIEGIYSFIT